jgi:hypothetical protein
LHFVLSPISSIFVSRDVFLLNSFTMRNPRSLKYFIIFIITAPLLLSWGMYGHEHINRAAVLALPQPLQQFFYNHIDFVTQESTVPDLRKYTLNDRAENARHFIDLENYDKGSCSLSLDDVKKNLPDSFLQKNGILPWYIQEMMKKLTKAFKEKRKTEILFIAGDLGHYLGDAHMPLHTSVNHNGQFTNQKGIHSFWEAHLPEIYGDTYNYYTGEATYITDIREETWRIIHASHALCDTLLLADRELTQEFAGKNIYQLDSSAKVMKNKFGEMIHSKEYAARYHDKLNGMIERQLRLAITATASFWYTAWVNAGKPDLSDLDTQELTTQSAKQLKKELKEWKEGKLPWVKSEKEF